MRKSPITIALAIAGIIAGTHASIAAISNESTEKVSEAVTAQTQPQAAAQEQAQVQVPVETMDPASQPQVLAQAPTVAPAPAKTSKQMDERLVRIPFTNIHLKVTQSTFPSAAEDHAAPLPSVVAYFDQKNANTMLTGAPGSAFPTAATEHSAPLPATVAYLERKQAPSAAANTARERVTAYVEQVSQKIATNGAPTNTAEAPSSPAAAQLPGT